MRPYLLLALVFVVATVGVVLWPQKDAGNIITLSDGKQVEFLGTTIGGQTFTTEKPWHKTARRFLPSDLLKWIPAAVSGSCSSGSNSITVFLKVSDPSGARILGTPWQTYNAEDAAGFLYHKEGGYCSFGGGGSSQIFGLFLDAFPRREPSFRFHFLGPVEAAMGSLVVPNPLTGSFENWKPLPLPQTATNGPVILTLDSLWKDEQYRWQSVYPKWKLSSTNSHWNRAKVHYSTYLDSSGNEGQQLSPREPAWKLRAIVHREGDDDFLPSERWLLNDIAAPAKDTFTTIDQGTNLLGVAVVAQVISSPGRFYVTNGVSRALDPSDNDGSGSSSSWNANTRVESWGYKKPFLLLQVSGQEPGDEIRIKVFDEQGRKLNTDADATEIGTTFYRTRFDIPSDVKTLALEVIVSRPLVFDFMVNPKDVQPAKPSPKP